MYTPKGRRKGKIQTPKQPEGGVIFRSGQGRAFISDETLERWERQSSLEDDADRDMIGDDAANFGLRNIGNK